MNKRFALLCAIIIAMAVSACAPISIAATGLPERIDIPEFAFPDAPVGGVEQSADARIEFSGNSAVVTGPGALAGEGEVTITAPGEYLLCGEYAGTLIIDVSEESKTVLILNGVSIRGVEGAAVWVKSQPKNVTFITCAGSVNLFSDAPEYAYDENLEDAPSAALYSREDLKFRGEGALYVRSHGQKGIQSKDDIEIESGAMYVIAADDGIRGKDSITISGGETHVLAGADGLRANNDEDEGKGAIDISGGYVCVSAGQDGAQAVSKLNVSGGTLVIRSGGGSVTAAVPQYSDNRGRGGFGGKQTKPTQDTASAKGLKADMDLIITGGVISIDALDDSIHANGNITVTGGSVYAASSDDGMHADETLAIEGGSILIPSSYEGIEAKQIIISSGEIRVTASDDGLNAAGGADGSSVNGRPGQNWGRRGMDSGIGSIEISGGYLIVNASGDGIDSNGTVDMTGGTAIVYGPVSSGNGALDYARTFTFEGGTLLATGAAGMAQSVSSDITGVLAFACQMDADELMLITDADGGEVTAFKSPKRYGSVIYASDKLTKGATYNVYAGGVHAGKSADGVYEPGATSDAVLLGSLAAG